MSQQLQIYNATQNWRKQVVARLGNGAAALAADATTGFMYVPTVAGTPTGIPDASLGFAPIVVDSINNLLYFYSNGAWRSA